MSNNKEKKKARIIQDETGLKYMTCLQLLRGEIAFRPATDKCLVAIAVSVVRSEYTPTEKSKPCSCSVCEEARKQA